MKQPPIDYDGAWKEALEQYFAEFTAFFFPQVHAGIDWQRPYQLLPQELQQVTRDAELGRQRVDQLVQVWRNDGHEAWVLVHVEVQGWKQLGVAERMYVYNYRLFDQYQRPVVSLAVLCNERADWKPQQYARATYGAVASNSSFRWSSY